MFGLSISILHPQATWYGVSLCGCPDETHTTCYLGMSILGGPQNERIRLLVSLHEKGSQKNPHISTSGFGRKHPSPCALLVAGGARLACEDPGKRRSA